MFLNQLIDQDRSTVVVHGPTGVVKLLAASGAVFNSLPLSADDIDETIAQAHAILQDDKWEVATPDVARTAFARWKTEALTRKRESFIRNFVDVLDATNTRTNQRTPTPSAVTARHVWTEPHAESFPPPVRRGSHLKLVHDSEGRTATK